MKKIFINTIFILLIMISCNNFDNSKNLIPNKLNISNDSIKMLVYDVTVYEYNKDLNLNELEKYPLNKFPIWQGQNYEVLNWVSFKKLPRNDFDNILNRINNDNEFNDEKIKYLISSINSNPNSYYLSGFYKQEVLNNKTIKFFYYFYVLSINDKIIFEFDLILN